MEGGFNNDREAVREYWTRQWQQIGPRVEPVQILPDEAGRWHVKVHQVVGDLAGNLLVDQTVYHLYTITDGLVKRIEVASQ